LLGDSEHGRQVQGITVAGEGAEKGQDSGTVDNGLDQVPAGGSRTVAG
jgi:hypothetical protein